jgi:hypothetical protein
MEGIIYRKAVGRVQKDVLEIEARNKIEVTLG